MQDASKVYIDSYTTSKWIMFHDHMDYFKKPPLGGTPTTKPGDLGIPNTHSRWFILFYHM
jgi:hypothetical protein